MINPILIFSDKILLFSKEKVVNSLSDKQKNILLIASAALAFLAACYIATRCCIKFQQSFFEVDNPAAPLKKIDEKADPSEKADPIELVDQDMKLDPFKIFGPPVPFNEPQEIAPSLKQARDLIFNDVEIDEMGYAVDRPAEIITKRHEDLKNLIKEISLEDINVCVDRGLGMHRQSTTLLLETLMHIEDPLRRLEIIKLLLEKGADPRISGNLSGSTIIPLEVAKKIYDEQVIDLLENALKDLTI